MKPPYFPFYVKDFSADSVVEAMSTLEIGSYTLLLCKAWHEEPPGSLPNNDTVLARWARLDPTTWQDCKPGVLAAFKLGTDNRWHQKRMRTEFSKMMTLIQKRSEAGKKGAAVTHGKASGIANGKASGPGHGKNMANGSGSESGFGFGSSSEELGMQGEEKPPKPPFERSPEFLSTEWKQYVGSTVRADQDVVLLTSFFTAWLETGFSFDTILAEIRRKGRDRTESTWKMKNRLCGAVIGAEKKTAQSTPDEIKAKAAARYAAEDAAKAGKV